MRDTEREAETQAEGEAGSMQGAPCGTRSQDPGPCPELKADAQPLSHPGIPIVDLFISNFIFSTFFFASVIGREMVPQRCSCPNPHKPEIDN